MIICIHNMPRAPLNYFRYFALSRDADIWGIGLTAVGFRLHFHDGAVAPRTLGGKDNTVRLD